MDSTSTTVNTSSSLTGNLTYGVKSASDNWTKAADYLGMIYPAIYFSVGVPLNVTNIFMVRNRWGKSSHYVYVIILSLVDSLVLTHRATSAYLPLASLSLTTGWCVWMQFASQILPQLSSWTLVLMCLERAIVVNMPFSSLTLFTHKRAMIVLSIAALILTAINSFAFFAVRSFVNLKGDQFCGYREKYLTLIRTVWYKLLAVLYVLLPFSLLIILNLSILYGIYKARLSNRDMNPNRESTNSKSGRTSIYKSRSRISSNVKKHTFSSGPSQKKSTNAQTFPKFSRQSSKITSCHRKPLKIKIRLDGPSEGVEENGKTSNYQPCNDTSCLKSALRRGVLIRQHDQNERLIITKSMDKKDVSKLRHDGLCQNLTKSPSLTNLTKDVCLQHYQFKTLSKSTMNLSNISEKSPPYSENCQFLTSHRHSRDNFNNFSNPVSRSIQRPHPPPASFLLEEPKNKNYLPLSGQKSFGRLCSSNVYFQRILLSAVIASGVFLMTTLPYCTVSIWFDFIYETNNSLISFLVTLSVALCDLNHVTNFFIYSIKPCHVFFLIKKLPMKASRLLCKKEERDEQSEKMVVIGAVQKL